MSNNTLENTKIYVLHVKKGYEEREQHIVKLMKNMNLSFEWILDGDMDDITEEILDTYFKENSVMHEVAPHTSCALKHFLTYRNIVENQLPGAIVLEDDIILYPNFKKVFEELLREIDTQDIKNPIVYLEDDALKFVPRSLRKKGQHLYRIVNSSHFTGCMYVTYGAAKHILDVVEREKTDLPIDVYHEYLLQHRDLNLLFCHPFIATQGSHTGLFASSINAQSAKKQKKRQYTWLLKKWYKQLLYFCR